jgi:D-allose transport system permease protein
MDKFRRNWEKYGTFGILLLLLIVLSILEPRYFLKLDNFRQIGLQSTVFLLLAYGEFFAILIAGIDLSVGAVAGLSGMLMAMMMNADMPVAVAIIIGLLIATTFGAINGSLVNVFGLHPFVITLGTQAIFRGITLVISKGSPVFNLPMSFRNLASYWLGIPIPVLIAAIVAIILILFTKQTVVGRNLFALGGNKQAAWYSGINTKLYTLIAHTLSGLMAGVAGLVMTARIGAAEPLAGNGYETFAIAACIIGGTSFFGGKGKVIGVVIGGLIIGTISNGLNILNVPSFWQQVVMGSLIIASVALDKVVGTSSGTKKSHA